MSKKLPTTVRKDQLIEAAMRVSRKVGYNHITRREIAEDAKVSEALVSLHWGTMQQVRRAVMRQAVTRLDLVIVAQGLAARDPIAIKAPEQVKEKAIRALV